jgi:hypothetical protein
MRVNASTVFAGLGSLVLTSASMAAYTGVSLEAQSITDTTMVLRLYANFDAAGDTVVNVFNANINSSHAFEHANPFGFPDQALPFIAFLGGVGLFDSWVSIGVSPAGDGGSSALDPGFNGFLNGASSIGAGSGWFNSNPPNLQGQAGADGKVELAQFAFIGDPGTFVTISGSLALTSTVGTFNGQAVAGTFQFTPAPGALALLGVAGLASRRRRA